MIKRQLIMLSFILPFLSGCTHKPAQQLSTKQPITFQKKDTVLNAKIAKLEKENRALKVEIEQLLSQLNSLEASLIEEYARERDTYEAALKKEKENSIYAHIK